MVLGEFGDQLIAVQYHYSDAWTADYSSERRGFYGVTGTPTIVIDGKNKIVGTYGSCTADANAYRNAINQRLAATGGLAPVGIDGVYSYTEDDITLTATFELLDPVTLVDPKAHVVVIEDGLHYGGNVYNHVTRAGQSEMVTLENQGDQAVVTATFPMGNWDMARVQCIAFLQRNSGSSTQVEMYQAAKLVKVEDFTFAFDCKIASVPAGNGDVEFNGLLTNISDSADEFTVSLDNSSGWTAEFMLEGEAEYHTTPSMITLGPGEDIAAFLRVSTDGELRTGSDFLVVTSTNSERTQSNQVVAYNGSPAVLLVDDDSMYPYETILTNGLDAHNYLYHHWDVYNDHSGAGPTFADMKCYDVVIWHQGYGPHVLFTAEEIEDVKDFMDLGKGFILSAQDYLDNPIDMTFVHDYLGIASYTTYADADHLTGVGGDPISDGIDTPLDYLYSVWDRADHAETNAYGTAMLFSEDMDQVGIRADNGTAKAVTFTFCMNGMDEGAANPNNPATLIDRAIQWVLPAGGQSVPEINRPVLASQIRAVQPNPFSARSARGETAIRLRISERAALQPARLDVLDISGRLVRNLVDGVLPVGVTEADWDGRDAAGQPVTAGVYYVRFQTADGTHGARAVVID